LTSDNIKGERTMQSFIDFLKATRKAKNLSTHKLAELSGVSQSYLSNLETGKRKNPPSPEIISKLSTALEIDYFQVMRLAGYLEVSKKENDYTFEKAVSCLSELEKIEILKNMFENEKEYEKLLKRHGLEELFSIEFTLRAKFGDYLRLLRIAKNISLIEISNKSGISVEILLEYESGKRLEPPLDDFFKIGKVLEIEDLDEWLKKNTTYYHNESNLRKVLDAMDLKDARATEANTINFKNTSIVSFEVSSIEATVDNNGYSVIRVIPNEELKERFFSLEHVLERDGNVYYKGHVLTKQEREKIKKILEIFFEE
jgi:transcriptional regulator with XRE-family HTH domain